MENMIYALLELLDKVRGLPLTDLQKDKLKECALLKLHCCLSISHDITDGRFNHDITEAQLKRIREIIGLES